ncbi:MAG: HTTM domain-containing protein [Spirochaetota bacterium]
MSLGLCLEKVKQNSQIYLAKSISNTSLCLYRIAFGVLLQIIILRFFTKGWVEKYFLQPKFFFKHFVLQFLPHIPANLMPMLLWFLWGLAFLVTIGLFYRISIILFTIFFTYMHFYDISYYLNHYYLVSLLCLLLCFLHVDERFSVKSLFKKGDSQSKTFRWQLDIILLQISIVYFFGFVAKCKSDWLLEAMPLKIWLLRHSSVPYIGSLLSLKITAYLFSYAGFLFDMLVPFLLISSKHRKLGLFCAYVFHAATYFLFQIGMFPFIMLVSIHLFIPPHIYDSLLPKLREKKDKPLPRIPVWKSRFLSVYILFQILFPLRFLLYPGKLAWTEEGFRFSWNIMIVQKAGYVEFRVVDTKTGSILPIEPKDYITPFQYFMMSTQADMIVQFAHFLKNRYQDRQIAVYVESFVSLNGKPAKRYIDPKVDLTQVDDSIFSKTWILE